VQNLTWGAVLDYFVQACANRGILILPCMAALTLKNGCTDELWSVPPPPLPPTPPPSPPRCSFPISYFFPKHYSSHSICEAIPLQEE